jgi:threonine synthase
MLYQSTRGGERGVPFEKVLLSAYASDGGLYVPESLPTLSVSELSSWAGMSMAQVCARMMEYFTDLPLAELDVLSAAAFGSFNDGNEPSLPMRQVGDLHYLDTGLGPTLAFKDIGQQVVAQLVRDWRSNSGLSS